MSARQPHTHHRRDIDISQLQFVGAALLIALGLVFLALQAGILKNNANWWVIFLLIPGLGLLWNGFMHHQDEQAISEPQVIEIGLGVILLLLTVIFIFDPTWSFLGSAFRSDFWDRAWRFIVLGLGLILLVAGVLRRWTSVGVLGALTTIVGLVFVFNINWDYVWPLALILPGLWLLYNALRRPEA